MSVVDRPRVDEGAGDDVCVQSLTDNVLGLHFERMTDGLRRWLARLDPNAIAGAPEMRLAIAGALAVVGRADDAARLVRTIDIEPPSGALAAAVLARCHETWGEPTAALELFDAALDALGPVTRTAEVDTRLHLFRLSLLASLDDADGVRIAHRTLRLDGLQEGAAAPLALAIAALVDGDLGAAEEIATRTDEPGHEQPAAADFVLGAVADLRHEPHAIKHLERALAAAEDRGAAFDICRASCALARARHARGDTDIAYGLLAAARRPRHARPLSTTCDVMIATTTARLLLVDGDGDAADACLASLPASAATLVLRAWREVVVGRPRLAMELLAELPSEVRGQDDIDRSLVLARASAAVGDIDGALDHMRTAISIGASDGWIRPFLEHGPSLGALVRGADDGPVASAYVHSLLEVIAPGSELTALAVLTDREREVLIRMAGSSTNQELAGALGMSVNTLKTHVKAIYRKLGVQGRAEAVDLARRTRTLP